MKKERNDISDESLSTTSNERVLNGAI